MNTAFLLIGSNLDNRPEQLQKALSAIAQQCGTIMQTSAVYETAAWGLEDQPYFLNQAIKLQTFQIPMCCSSACWPWKKPWAVRAT